MVTVLLHAIDADIRTNVKPNEKTSVKAYIQGSSLKFTLRFSRNELQYK